ncbi:MAG: Carboxypeptidase-related protein [Planctomycetota bacterium]|nr:Carboxypeptidase-related protein [Planctomycetota bacterium]
MRPRHAMTRLAVLATALLLIPSARGQSPPKPADPHRTSDADAAPAVSHHEISVGGKTLKYTATAGLTPIKNEKGEVEARIFSIAYTLDDQGDKSKRPLMFSFNGGPGSSSVWLHMGALGPKRVEMPDDAEFAKPPFKLVDNEATWLDRTDLVFIDPVGTGYSRAAKPELNAKFHGLRGDIDSVGEFIRLYLSREDRWISPLYLVGESYGTTRAAGLSDSLVEKGIALNGIVLVSSVLNFQTLQFATGNDLPYVLFLPTYAATAWYHKKLPDDLQKDLKATLADATRWAAGDYALALEKGDRLTTEERREIIAKLSRYTGLDASYIDSANLRVDIQHFCKQLLRKEKMTVGRLDSRFKGVDASNVSDTPENDPSMSAIRPPYTATFNAYVRSDLAYRTDVPYHILGEGVGRWDFGVAGRGGFADTSSSLRDAMSKNPSMKVFVGSGYYDLATPFFATEYTLAHMNLDEKQRSNVRLEYYEAGHMMYLHGPSLKKLKADVAGFLGDAVSK